MQAFIGTIEIVEANCIKIIKSWILYSSIYLIPKVYER